MLEEYKEKFGAEEELKKEFEKIEIAYVKTKERYGESDECGAFIDYIRTIEKIFTESKIKNWDAEKSKQELIEIETNLLAERMGVDKKFLALVYEDFKSAYASADKVLAIKEKLLEKYKDNAECCELIIYIAYIYINFNSIQKEELSMEGLKNNLIKARMNVISCDGSPDLIILENIYDYFKEEINK